MSSDILIVALLAAKMHNFAVDDPFYPFLPHKVGAALRVLDKFGVGYRAGPVLRMGLRKERLPDLFDQKIGNPHQYSVEEDT